MIHKTPATFFSHNWKLQEEEEEEEEEEERGFKIKRYLSFAHQTWLSLNMRDWTILCIPQMLTQDWNHLTLPYRLLYPSS